MNYTIADPTKINTRFSELKRATPGSIERLVLERHGDRRPFTSGRMEFGTLRHEMWEQEAKETGKLPTCFGIDEPVDLIEEEFAVQITPDIVVYLRPDAISTVLGTVNDYKTMAIEPGMEVAGKARYKYRVDMQLSAYAYLLTVLGMTIKRRRYLVEIWDQQLTTVLGYDTFEEPITVADHAHAKKWLQTRAEMLTFGERQYELKQGTI